MTEGWKPPSQQELARRLGRAVRAEREQRRWTQQELAERLGMTPPYVSQVEGGMVNPTLVTLVRLAQTFHLPLAWFLSPPDHPLGDLFREPPPFERSQRLLELATLGRRVVDAGEAG